MRAYQHTLASLVEGRPVSWLRQVHGHAVASVPPGVIHSGTHADAQVTQSTHAALAVFTADCAPVLLCSVGARVPVLGVAHVGWKGLLAGVLDATVAAMQTHSRHPIEAYLGPCIGAGCYEFTGPQLNELTHQLGPQILTVSKAGTRTLDLRAALSLGLARHGVPLDVSDAVCTACDGEHYSSHRARAESFRQALLAWVQPS